MARNLEERVKARATGGGQVTRQTAPRAASPTSTGLQTRKPTGKPSWPITLIAGVEKAGKTYAAAEASASDLVGRTFWIGVGEDDPDEYGAIPGARFEIVLHDGTYRGILTALTAAANEPAEDGKPNLIVVDSAGRLWDLLSEEAQVTANKRAAAKAAKYNRQVDLTDDVSISMDLWNTAKQRWQHLLDVLRTHQGPSIVTARLEVTTVMNEKGEPTKDKAWKVKAEKGLPFDVGVIVEMHARGETYLTGVRSLRFKPADDSPRTSYPEFTVDQLWRDLGLADEAGPRAHAKADPTGAGESEADHLRRQIATWCQAESIDLNEAVGRFAEQHNNSHIKDESDPAVLQGFWDAWKAERELQSADVTEVAS